MNCRRRFAAIAIALALLAPELRAQRSSDIVFVGSSIFRRWTALTSQMAPLRVRNVSMDGGETYQMLGLLDVRVLPLEPKVVAYYAGSNDVDFDEAAGAIAGRVVQFIERLETARPGTPFVFVSVMRSPDHEDRWTVIDEVNRQVAQYAATHPLVHVVDVNPIFFDAKGKPRVDLYMPDGRHLRPAGYEQMARIVKPVLESIAGS